MRNTDYTDFLARAGSCHYREKGRLHTCLPAGRDFKRRLMFLATGFCLLVSGTYVQQKAEASTREETLQDAQKHYAAGKELIQQGNYAAANHEFKKAQGLLQAVSLENPLSTKDALKAIVPETNKSRTLQQAAGYSGKVRDYLKAIGLAPGDVDLHYNLALLYLKTKQYQEAARSLEKVIQLNPKDKDAYYNLGVLYESYLGDKKKALDYYAQYIKYGPENGDALEVKQWMRQFKKELKK